MCPQQSARETARLSPDPTCAICDRRAQGFGFIVPDDGTDDVFCHQVRAVSPRQSLTPRHLSSSRPARTQTQIYAPGFRSLAEGEMVEFKKMEFNGRIQASDVTDPDGSYVQGTLPPARRNDDDL